MNKIFYAIGWIAFHFVKRATILSLVVAIWIGSILAVSASGFATSVVGSLASWAGITTVHSVIQSKTKTVAKRVNRRTKRILVVNGLGAAGSWLLWGGAVVATGAAAYEAVMICENSNDLRDLQRLIGIEPDESIIGDNCEQAREVWEEWTPDWVREFVQEKVEETVDQHDPIIVWIDGRPNDINEVTNPDWIEDVLRSSTPINVWIDGRSIDINEHTNPDWVEDVANPPHPMGKKNRPHPMGKKKNQ